MNSYQRRKQDIAYLRQYNAELSNKAEFFKKAIWDAREAIGDWLGIRPFSDLYDGEEQLIISDKEGLLGIIRGMPLRYNHPGIKGDDFLTPVNCPEL